MMRTSVGFRLAMAAGALALVAPDRPLAAQYPVPSDQSVQQAPDLFTVDELDNLLAPVALYPDPILAQLLVAATYPEQIALAARYVRTYGDRDIDRQGWDVSVKAVARYLPVLNMLAEREDWTVALGQAYALQPGDVMASVQGLREMAYQQGNLVSTAEHRVEYAPRAIRIVPAQPRVIYVPTYDPTYIYFQPVHYARVRTSHWSFGIAFPIGVWLNYDVDWGHHRVYYHGWEGYHAGGYSWYHVSRPFISFNTVYVNPYRTVVVINRNVIHRRVNYIHFNTYRTVHRKVAWDRHDLPGRRGGGYPSRPGRWDDDPRGGERGNDRGGNGRRVADDAKPPKYIPETNRVTPTPIGGTRRPLYPTQGTSDGSRTAQPRTSATQTSAVPRGVEPANTPSRYPATAPGSAWPRNAPAGGDRALPSRTSATRTAPVKSPKQDAAPDRERYQPTRATPSAPRTASVPQAMPSSSPRNVPRASQPDRTGARSLPSAPRTASPPRASSAPRAQSQPRAASAPSRSPDKGQARSAPRTPSKPDKPSGKRKPDGG
ncbi:MAG: DUF3300 domain-containing protein [Gemmatimonadetes bacterium]|nr:DUF3300 domain-containing protein [Gemmatimonadota bacterium]